MTKVTPKQAMLLFFLLWVLVAAVVFMYVLTPLIDEKSDAETQVEFLQSDYDRLVMEAGRLNTQKTANERLTAELSQACEKYYDVMTTAQADELVLKLLESCGASAESLAVSAPVAVEGGLVVTDDESSVTDSESEDSTSAAVKATKSGIVYSSLDYAVTADYSEMIKFIEAVNNDECLMITSIAFAQDLLEQTQTDENAPAVTPVVGKNIEFTLTVALLMFDK